MSKQYRLCSEMEDSKQNKMNCNEGKDLLNLWLQSNIDYNPLHGGDYLLLMTL